MSSMVSTFVHAIYSLTLTKSALCKKWHNLVPLDRSPLLIQTPFNSSCAALQYETGMMFFHRSISEIAT